MDVVVCPHAITSIWTLTQAKTKAHVHLELDTYFDELICIATSPNLSINADTIHKYVVDLAAMMTMMHIL